MILTRIINTECEFVKDIINKLNVSSKMTIAFVVHGFYNKFIYLNTIMQKIQQRMILLHGEAVLPVSFLALF